MQQTGGAGCKAGGMHQRSLAILRVGLELAERVCSGTFSRNSSASAAGIHRSASVSGTDCPDPRGPHGQSHPTLGQARGYSDSGWLRGHIARANPLWRALRNDAQVLAIFTGAEHYISPNWYPSKYEHGKVAADMELCRRARQRLHPVCGRRLLATGFCDLVDRYSRAGTGPSLARERCAGGLYSGNVLRAIIGFEITISNISGKFNGSQNRPAADRAGAMTGLLAEGATPEKIWRRELVPGLEELTY